MTAPLVLELSEIAPNCLALVGGKGLNLGRLLRAGLRVPPGFVVTTEAYARREEQAVRAAIENAYALLGGRVAVRSSATAEDLVEASGAGQQATFLNVEGTEAVLEAVRGCWASLFAERAVAYRRARGIAEEHVAMAVVVERMIDADAAGVLFTRDPTDVAAERMVLESAYGLGESVVSGRVTPDRWTLSRAGATLTSETARKMLRLTRNGEEAVPDELQFAPSLAADSLRALAELGRAVEQEFGTPQDIEWAVYEGVLFVLQSRPITVGGAQREQVRAEEIAWLRERAAPGGTVWARYSLSEVLPEPLPLTWGFWRQFMSGGGGYGRMYRELGYDPDPELESDGVLDLVAGRPYFNLSRDACLYFRHYPFDYPFEKLKANPELAIYPRPEPNLAKAPKGFVLKLPGVMRQMLAGEKTLERAAEEVPGQLEEVAFPGIAELAQRWRAESLGHFSDGELLNAVEETRAAVFDRFLSQGLKPGVLAGLALLKLQGELRGPLGEQARPVSEQLLAGVAPPEEYDLAGSLRALSEGRCAREEFVQRFGHRGPGEMELANPRWREMPDRIPVPSGGGSDAGTTAATGLEVLLSGKKANMKQAQRYLQRARRFTALRETSKHFLMLGYEVLRLLLLELDRRAGLHGGLFYLYPAELGELAGGPDLRPRIAERRKRRALLLGLEAPRVLFSDDLEAIGRLRVQEAGGGVLQGTGVSAGSAEGEALVLRSPDVAPEGVRDFILVCPSTDPGWVPLFVRARGVVLETGGILSHGAIVARELGLPAVANIPDACSRYTTGQRLRVDGTLGQVGIVDKS